jgi:hypothetical protein
MGHVVALDEQHAVSSTAPSTMTSSNNATTKRPDEKIKLLVPLDDDHPLVDHASANKNLLMQSQKPNPKLESKYNTSKINETSLLVH